MRILVWQWGRLGAGPRVAVELADGLRRAGASSVLLSLAEGAEMLAAEGQLRPRCELTMPTYVTGAGFVARRAATWIRRGALARKVAALAPQIALCAMPALLDAAMADALEALGIPLVAIIHDAELHPGDGVPLQMRRQRRLMARASALVTLSSHVEEQVRAQVGPGRPVIRSRLPPFAFGPTPAPPRAHGGRLRLLFFGRLLPYKGLDLLAAALERLGDAALDVRVVGSGPDSPTLDALRRIGNVTVENRWVAEGEIGALIAWADAMVLPYREASQSGVAAAALSARRWVVATAIGGLVDQFGHEPAARLCSADPDGIAGAIASLMTDPPTGAATSDPSADLLDTSRLLLRAFDERFGPFPPVGLAFGPVRPRAYAAPRPSPGSG